MLYNRSGGIRESLGFPVGWRRSREPRFFKCEYRESASLDSHLALGPFTPYECRNKLLLRSKYGIPDT